MSLINKAKMSIVPVRAQIDRLSEQHAVEECIEELVLPSGLIISRFEKFVDLEAEFSGRIGGVIAQETATLTFFDYDDPRELPVIRSSWRIGNLCTYRIGALGVDLYSGSEGDNVVGLKRIPQYAANFLDLLLDVAQQPIPTFGESYD